MRRASFILAAALLAGCGSDVEDLREFTRTAHANQVPKIEPVPELKPQDTYTYAAANLPDPFAAGKLRPEGQRAASAAQTVSNRRKEPLEEYPLDALKMVGTLVRGTQSWAIIRAPDGTVHRAQVGNYVGQYLGKITRISEARVDVLELIPGGGGSGLVEREAALAIAD